MTTLKERFENHTRYNRRQDAIIYNKNCEAWLDSDGTLQASSFGWWNVIHCKNGLYFFNWFCYSSYTSRHQSKLRKLMDEMGLDYISVSYSGHGTTPDLKWGGSVKNTLQNVAIESILKDKIESLYTGENTQSLRPSNAKYSVWSEESFNDTMGDIQKIAAQIKMKNAELDKLMIDAENKATEELFETLYEKSERLDSRKEARKQMQNFSAVAV